MCIRDSVAFRPPDGNQIVSISLAEIKLWESNNAHLTVTQSLRIHDPRVVAISADGKRLATADGNGRVPKEWTQ